MREPFNEQKLREGLYRALEKRPVGEEEVETLIEDIKKDIRSYGEREVRSRLIGEVIMKLHNYLTYQSRSNFSFSIRSNIFFNIFD